MYIDDVLSINNPNFANWIPLILPKELEIKATKVLDIYLKFDNNG
jgi:hypothetical protein